MKNEPRVLASKLASTPVRELSESEMSSVGGGGGTNYTLIWCGPDDLPGQYPILDTIDF